MKRILSIGLLTACVLVISEHQAQAWVNAKFSIGLNWHLQSANNNTLWGLWKNGQVPGPEAFGQPGGGGPFTPGQMTPGGVFPFYGSAPHNVGPNGIPVNFPHQNTPMMPGAVGQQRGYYPYTMPYYAPTQAPVQTPTPAPAQTAENLFRTTSYYSQPSNYYPMYQAYYGQQQAPYYWYQQR